MSACPERSFLAVYLISDGFAEIQIIQRINVQTQKGQEIMSEEKCLKQLGFDINAKALKKNYPSSHWQNGYTDIKTFMLANRFEKVCESGYRSKEKLSDEEVKNLVSELLRSLPWLADSLNDIIVTDVLEVYDFIPLIQGKADKKL